MNQKRHEVAIGEGRFARKPDLLSAKGLGSCVALIIYDREAGQGVMAHIMLPETAAGPAEPRTPFERADTAVAALLAELRRRGSSPESLRAKLIGGASMFADNGDSDRNIGARILKRAYAQLREHKVPLSGSAVGGRRGRSVEFDPASGQARVTTIGEPDIAI